MRKKATNEKAGRFPVEFRRDHGNEVTLFQRRRPGPLVRCVGENTALFRHEIRYEHSYDAPAYDLGTRKSQLMLAADLILFY